MADDTTQPEAVEDALPDTDGEIIASRGADIAAESSQTFDKVFVVAIVGGNKPTAGNDFDHEPNKAATREFAIQAGLRPTGEVTVKSTVANAGGGNVFDITYSVPVQLAADYEPAEEPVYVLEHDEDGNPVSADEAGTQSAPAAS